MEEERIFIETDDEITDVIDKLEKMEKDIAVLIIPKSALILQSIVNLKLLKRRAGQLNKRLAVVTDSVRGRKLAEKIGLSVYRKAKVDKIVKAEAKKKAASEVQDRFPLAIKAKSSLDKGEESEEKEGPKKPKRGGYSPWAKRLIAGLLIILLLAGGVGAYLYLPKATVRIKLKSKAEKKNFPIVIVTDNKPEKDQVSGEWVEAIAKVSDKFDATGRKQVGGRASGRITIYNYWSSDPQPLVASTRFIHNSSNKLFHSTELVTVPGTRVVEGQTVPGTATVNIQAEGVGESYNVTPGRFTIPGLSVSKQTKIYGQSDSGLTGGYEKEILVVSEDDYQKAKESLEKNLQAELADKFREKVAGKTVLGEKYESKVKESISPAIGEEAGSFTLTIQKKAGTIAYQEEEFLAKVKDKFDQLLENDQELILEGLGDRITIKETKLNLKERQASLELLVKGLIIPHLDEGILKQNLIGRDKSEGEKYLTGYSQIKDAELDLWPFWVKRVPVRESRLVIDISYE